MTKLKFTNRVAAFYLVAALLLPTFQPAFGAFPGRISDVGLTRTGSLVGQVVDNSGKPVANSAVEITASGQKAALATTNELGYFSIDNLQAGVYVASAPGTAKMVRVWAARTAPPAASDGLLLVQPEHTVRAQGARSFLRAHWLKIAIGLGIAGGVMAIAANDAS